MLPAFDDLILMQNTFSGSYFVGNHKFSIKIQAKILENTTKTTKVGFKTQFVE